jgi:glutamate-1-semialdehyde 2,1-aminomutase
MRCSAQIFAEAQTLLPGGVNSPVRAFKSVGGQPIIFESVNGPYCFDVDGNKVEGSLHGAADMGVG